MEKIAENQATLVSVSNEGVTKTIMFTEDGMAFQGIAINKPEDVKNAFNEYIDNIGNTKGKTSIVIGGEDILSIEENGDFYLKGEKLFNDPKLGMWLYMFFRSHASKNTEDTINVNG